MYLTRGGCASARYFPYVPDGLLSGCQSRLGRDGVMVTRQNTRKLLAVI